MKPRITVKALLLTLILIGASSNALSIDSKEYESLSEDNSNSTDARSGSDNWLIGFGSEDSDRVSMIETDSYGNTYVAGYFFGTLNTGESNITSNGDEDIYVMKINNDGIIQWVIGFGGTQEDFVTQILVDDNRGVIYIIGHFFSPSISFGSITLTNDDDSSVDANIFVAKLSTSGSWQWAKQAGGGESDYPYNSLIDLDGNVVIVGTYEEDNDDQAVDFGSHQLTVADSSNDGSGFLAKISSSGNWLMAEEISGDYCSITYRVKPSDVAIDSYGNLYVSGYFCESVNFGSMTLTSQYISDSSGKPLSAFVAKMSSNGDWEWAEMIEDQDSDSRRVREVSLALDSIGNVFVSGYCDTCNFGIENVLGSFILQLNTEGNIVWWYNLPELGHFIHGILEIKVDHSTDEIYIAGTFAGNLTLGDFEFRGYNQNGFIARLSPQSNGNFEFDWAVVIPGSWNLVSDFFIGSNDIYFAGSFQISTSYDGYTVYSRGSYDVFVGKLPLQRESDGDNFFDHEDDCPNQYGTSTEDRLGCPDNDGDGYSNPDGDSPSHPTGTADAFPYESTQWRDTDGDGFGDNNDGYQSDFCPSDYGTSSKAVSFDTANGVLISIVRHGCIDLDGDGYDDSTESYLAECPMNQIPDEWIDFDRDCVGHNSDFDDDDSDVQTLTDYCEKYPGDSQFCSDFEILAGIVNLASSMLSDAKVQLSWEYDMNLEENHVTMIYYCGTNNCNPILGDSVSIPASQTNALLELVDGVTYHIQVQVESLSTSSVGNPANLMVTADGGLSPKPQISNLVVTLNSGDITEDEYIHQFSWDATDTYDVNNWMICWAPWQFDTSEWESLVDTGSNCIETQNYDTDFTVQSSIICEGGCDDRLFFGLTGVDAIGNFDNSRATTVIDIPEYNSKQPIIDVNNNTANNETGLDNETVLDEESDTEKSDSTSSKSDDQESIGLELAVFSIMIIIISVLVILIYNQPKKNVSPNLTGPDKTAKVLPPPPLPGQVPSNVQEPAKETVTTLGQWTDESGHSWKKMSDGSSYWWNGKDWQIVGESNDVQTE